MRTARRALRGRGKGEETDTIDEAALALRRWRYIHIHLHHTSLRGPECFTYTLFGAPMLTYLSRKMMYMKLKSVECAAQASQLWRKYAEAALADPDLEARAEANLRHDDG